MILFSKKYSARAFLAVLFSVLLLFSGCSFQISQKYQEGAEDKLSVIATLFPQYDFLRQVAGDRAYVHLMITPGMSSQSYEPTAEDLIPLNKADLFVYTGASMEAWAADILASLDEEVAVLDVSEGISLDHTENSQAGSLHMEESEEGHVHTYDPHIWTSPKNAVIMVENIADALSLADPEGEAVYRANADAYIEQLNDLDERLTELVSQSSRKTLAFGGSFAFHYLFRDYGLTYLSAYDSCSGETEPSARAIAELITAIQEEQIPVIYYEELTEPTVAQSISEATGAKMLLLHSCHNVTAQELADGITYLDLMNQNLINLKEGLQ